MTNLDFYMDELDEIVNALGIDYGDVEELVLPVFILYLKENRDKVIEDMMKWSTQKVDMDDSKMN